MSKNLFVNKKIPFDVLKQVQHYRPTPSVKTHLGLGKFIPSIQEVEIRYCEHGGSSTPIKNFIRHNLKQLATEYPFVHFKVHPRPCKHPLIIGKYANDDFKQICVKNLPLKDIRKQMFNILNSQNARTTKIPKSKLPVIEYEKRVPT